MASSSSGWWQELLALEHCEPFTKHGLGVHHFVEPCLLQLDGRDDGGRPRQVATIAHSVIGVFEREADKRLQRSRHEIVLPADLSPFRLAGADILVQRQR